jgi:hypothetical protein
MFTNYLFSQNNVFKFIKATSVALLMLGSSSIIHAQTIAQWTFENSQPNNAGPLNAEMGLGIASAAHAGASTFNSPSGNGSPHSFNANNWDDGDYFEFTVSTLGYAQASLSFNQTSSVNGPKTFEIQVSTDGINFTTLSGSTYDVTNASWNTTTAAGSAYNFNLTGMGNQPMLVIRLSVANGSTAVSGGNIASPGTSRVDNVVVTGSSIPLSVTLSSFSGTTQHGKNILTWNVQSEQNISQYEVESSSDGHNFHTVGKVIALNRSGSTAYSFTDENNEGIAYYRLKIMDMEAGYTFSRILAIDGKHSTPNVSLGLNPVQDILPVLVSGSNGNVSLKIFNISGSMVFNKSYSCTGNAALNVDVNSLPPGTYILKASATELSKTVRFVKY